jgi:metal-responsive CopG/Arc/MetJ family transcriptional regulator
VKAHISATIDEQLVEDLNRYGLEERRSRSQVIEMAFKKFLSRRLDLKDEIVTSEGQFQGRFIREETYDR